MPIKKITPQLIAVLLTCREVILLERDFLMIDMLTTDKIFWCFEYSFGIRITSLRKSE